jgi:hypothetical protein
LNIPSHSSSPPAADFSAFLLELVLDLEDLDDEEGFLEEEDEGFLEEDEDFPEDLDPEVLEGLELDPELLDLELDPEDFEEGFLSEVEDFDGVVLGPMSILANISSNSESTWGDFQVRRERNTKIPEL